MSTPKTKGKKSAKKKAAPKKKLSLSETRKRNRSKRLKKEADRKRYLKKRKAASKPAKIAKVKSVPANRIPSRAEIGLNGKTVDHKKNMTMLGNVAEEMAAQTHDEVNHPGHYTSGKIEVIDFIEDQKLDMHTGNAVKYIARAGKKDPAKEITDLEKAEWYIRRKISNLKKAKEAAAPKKLDIRSSDGKK